MCAGSCWWLLQEECRFCTAMVFSFHSIPLVGRRHVRGIVTYLKTGGRHWGLVIYLMDGWFTRRQGTGFPFGQKVMGQASERSSTLTLLKQLLILLLLSTRLFSTTLLGD